MIMLILDVREREEYEAEHIPGSVLCPLSQIHILAPGLLKNIDADEVVVMCRTGNRAAMAIRELRKLDEKRKFVCYEGGILSWKISGKEVTGTGGIFPIMRQVQILASTMIFIAFLASYYFQNNSFVYLALFVGFGLAMAGWTGFCPAAKLLQMMPWNRRVSTTNSESRSSSCCN